MNNWIVELNSEDDVGGAIFLIESVVKINKNVKLRSVIKTQTNNFNITQYALKQLTLLETKTKITH